MRSASEDLTIRARRAVLPSGTRAAAVRVTGAGQPGGGRIAAVGPFDQAAAAGATVTLADDEVLLPGLVDTHVHVNEPGRDHWEGFATATRAAAAGGITTIIDMPLNSIPPTTNAGALRIKREVAAGQVHVDVGFWGGAVPGSTGWMPGLRDGGAFGFKVFLADSGVPEFPPVDEAGLRAVMAQAAALGSVVLVHAEDARVLGAAPPAGRSYDSFLLSRPPAAEVIAVEHVIAAAERAAARVHLLHLSAADAVPLLSAAKSRGARVTAETCPHYLALTAEEIPDGATQFKCCPPIRAQANRERLWQALRDGIIDCVVSDHSPCPPALKRLDQGDFGAAWGGISSVQLSLPVVWTQARGRGFSLDDVARWMAARPAEIAGLAAKGRIAPGCDADLVAFAPEESFAVDPGRLQHRHPLTPYTGRRLHGVVRRTWLRGVPADGKRPAGVLLKREEPGT
jgi:allantoinase